MSKLFELNSQKQFSSLDVFNLIPKMCFLELQTKGHTRAF